MAAPDYGRDLDIGKPEPILNDPAYALFFVAAAVSDPDEKFSEEE